MDKQTVYGFVLILENNKYVDGFGSIAANWSEMKVSALENTHFFTISRYRKKQVKTNI
jgi:hypothetical protein